MNGESLPQAVAALSNLSINNVHKRKIDLLVLRHIAQQLRLTLHTIEQPLTDNPPFLYTSTERHCCSHRIAIYDPLQLLQNKPLAFVGFVSGRKVDKDSTISQDLHAYWHIPLWRCVLVAGITWLCYKIWMSKATSGILVCTSMLPTNWLRLPMTGYAFTVASFLLDLPVRQWM